MTNTKINEVATALRALADADRLRIEIQHDSYDQRIAVSLILDDRVLTSDWFSTRS